jgi:hypothetical protein
MRNAYCILLGKQEEERLFGRPRLRWEGIEIGLKETGWEVVDWIHLTRDRN